MSEPDVPAEIFPFTLELDVGNKRFESYDSFLEWVAHEREFFAWVATAVKTDANTKYVETCVNRWLHSLTTFQNQYNSHKEDSTRISNAKKALVRAIETSLNKGELISSGDIRAKYSKTLSEIHNGSIATFALGTFLNLSTPRDSNGRSIETPDLHIGRHFALTFSYGSEESVQPYKEALSDLRNEWDEKFIKIFEEIQGKSEYSSGLIDSSAHSFKKVQGEMTSIREKQGEDFEEMLSQSKESLSDIETTYDNKLALQSSIQYWSKKQEKHGKALWVAGAVTAIFAICTAAVFVGAAYRLINASAADIEVWRLGTLLAISTFGIWATRLSSKIYISNLHLSTDAEERVTMIQTYLALLREGSGPKEDERQLILQTLFRPSATGYIKDDGPSSFIDIANSMLTKK